MAADAAILDPLARQRGALRCALVAHRVEPTVLVRGLAATSRVLACGESASRATNADQVELSFLREPIDRREMNPAVPMEAENKEAPQPLWLRGLHRDGRIDLRWPLTRPS